MTKQRTMITKLPEALKAGQGKSMEWNIKNNPFIFTDPDVAQQLHAYSTQKYGDGRLPAEVVKITNDYISSQRGGESFEDYLTRSIPRTARAGQKQDITYWKEYQHELKNPSPGRTTRGWEAPIIYMERNPIIQRLKAERAANFGPDGKRKDPSKGYEPRIATMQRLGIEEVRGRTAIDELVAGYNKARAGNKFAGTNIDLGTVGLGVTGAMFAGAAMAGAPGAGAAGATGATGTGATFPAMGMVPGFGGTASSATATGAGSMSSILGGISSFLGGGSGGGGGFLGTVGNIVKIGSGINSIVSGISNNQAIDKGLADQEAYLGGINNQVQEMQDRWNEIYLPIERDLGNQIQSGVLNPEVEANRAALDVSNEYERGQEIADRNLNRMGIDPSSPRGIANIKKNLNIAEAAARAGAKTNSRRASRLKNFELRNDFLRQGRGLPSSISSQYGNLAKGAQNTLGNINKYGAQGTGGLNPYLSGAGDIYQASRDIGLTDWLKNKFSGGSGIGQQYNNNSVKSVYDYTDNPFNPNSGSNQAIS